MVSHDQALIAVLKEERDALLNACSSATHCPSANSAAREETDALLDALQEALQGDAPDDLRTEGWSHARQLLDALSASRAAQGQSAGDTSAFALALTACAASVRGPQKPSDSRYAVGDILCRSREVFTSSAVSAR